MRKKIIGLLKSNMDVLKAAGISATATLRLADHLIANDVVPVVRCKDCKHCDFFYPVKELDKEAIPAWYCKKQRGDRKPDDFCSFGERRI